MLHKTNRLTKDKEYDNVFRNGKSNYGKLVGLKSAPNGLNFVRVGVMVSNKVSKKATERNKLKRQIREIFRDKLASLEPGYDLVAVVLPAARGSAFKELEASIDVSLKKLRMYGKKNE